jgi:hypothetical protein
LTAGHVRPTSANFIWKFQAIRILLKRFRQSFPLACRLLNHCQCHRSNPFTRR